MRNEHIPLVNRGAEALSALLDYDEGAAESSLRLLTLSELTYLSSAADRLAAMARAVRHGRAPDGMDTRGYWARSNPSLGIRITEETIARELRSMGRAGGTSDDQASGGPI